MTDATAVARALRQRLELGAPAFFFSGLDRDTAMSLASAGMRARTRAEPHAPQASVALSVPSVVEATARRPASSAAPAAAPSDPGPVTPAPIEPRPAEDAPTPTVPAPPDTEGMTIQALREAVSVCTRCGLSETRSQAVFADGHPDARVMVVGEAPGANEDRTGLPFVGAAG